METEIVKAAPVKRNPYAKFLLDKEIAKAGVYFEDENVRVLVTFAGTENNRYDKMLKLKLKPFETRIRNDDFPDTAFRKILGEVYAANVVLNWESKLFTDTIVDGEVVEDTEGVWVQGIYDEEGNILDFTEANVIKGFALGDRLFQDVIKVATNFNLFRQGQKEADAKN